MGAKLSEIYKERIDHYLLEYEKLSFSNNFNEKTRQIIDNAIRNAKTNSSIDNYVQCSVCHQSSYSAQAHQREKCEPYESIFKNESSVPSLEQIIGSDIWNWTAVEKTLIYLLIWNARDKWNQLSYYISEFKQPIEIICNSKRCCTLLIDKYEQNQTKLLELPTLLAQTTVIEYLPDSNEIQNLKNIFDRYDHEEQRGTLSKMFNNDQRTMSGHYYLYDVTTTKNQYIDRNDFCFPITNPPSATPDNRCHSCRKSFSMFTSHDYCRMCGQQHCMDCLLYKRIPHLGFITKPVRICAKCSKEKANFIYQHLFTYVKHLIEISRIQYLNIYLALLYQYQVNGNESFYQQTGEYYYQAGKYSLALQCFTYARLKNDEWFQYSIEFCNKAEYSYSFTCMKLCTKSDTFWLEQAISQPNPIYSLLCYQRIKLSIEQLFDVANEKLPDDIDTCLFYLLFINIKYPNEVKWIELGEKTLLKSKDTSNLAMFCFYLYGKMQIEEWNHIAERLCQSNQFVKLALLLVYLFHIQHIDFPKSKNHFIYFLTKILLANSTKISLDYWLDDICDASIDDINRMIIGLSILHVYSYTDWIEYKNKYIERKEYFKTLLCHKMAEYLNQQNDKQWFINAIEDFDPVGYELYNGTNCSSNWKQLADQYFQSEKFLIALNCYLFCASNQNNQFILQQAASSTLALPIALLYYTVVYKRTLGNSSKILSTNNSSVCNNTFYEICMVLSKQKHPLVLELVKSAVNIYETTDRFKDRELLKYHRLILNELHRINDENGTNDRLINGGMHILLSFKNLPSEWLQNLTTLNQPLLTKAKTQVFNNLKTGTYKSCVELTEILLDPTNYYLEQLKQVLQQCLGRLEISQVEPSEYRAKMYLIQSMIFKLENNVSQSLSSAHDALLSHPYETIMDSLMLFFNYSNFHQTVRQSLINDILKDPLNLIDITPPTQMKNLNFLKRTERLIMLKKYERAITKRLTDTDPIQAAYSYIDLIMAVIGSPTLYATSLTMSCLYFYKAMTNPACALPELYAYRSIIFELSTHIFVFTRHYLPLYIQMYIYKLLYTLILCSSDLFMKRVETVKQKQVCKSELIITDFHEIILDELLKNILQLSQANLFAYAPSTSTIHDIIYMEYAGNEFLAKYLKFMASTNSMYQYYYFEGIWKEWVDKSSFNVERENCMQDLLYDHCWIMDDVEDLLCWSLLPRTNDGWLLNTKHRLQFKSPGYSQVVGVTLDNDSGIIDFILRQAKKTEQNLFDATDLIDIIQNGIYYGHFTLDPPNTDYHSHPFNEMRYLPKRLSKVPNYLLTLLHTDYLLKMISTGVEINAFEPFEMRSSTENLVQRLPAHIRDELQAIAVKKSGLITDSIHRFWIQPQSAIEYEQTVYKGFFGRKYDNIIQYYLSDNLKMCVKQHRMKYDEKGNLIDDTDENEDDQSAEAQFARTFTKYYDEIGECFPELLRLKELIKLGFIARIIQVRYESQCEFASRIENSTELDKYLKELRDKIGRYPTGSEEADAKILTAISNNLCKQFFCKKSNIKPYLLDWLKCNRQQALSNYVKQNLIQEKAKLKFTIERLKLFYNNSQDSDRTMSNDPSICSWVPAAFSSDLSRKIYGGVSADADKKEVSGIKEQQEKRACTKRNANDVYKEAKSTKEDTREGTLKARKFWLVSDKETLCKNNNYLLLLHRE